METIQSCEVDIKAFSKRFAEEYEFLYDHCDNVAGYDKAVRAGDEFMKRHPEFVAEFARFRGDLITSDREAAAFMFALSSLI